MAIQKIQNLHICHPFDMVTPNNEAMKFHFGFYVLIRTHVSYYARRIPHHYQTYHQKYKNNFQTDSFEIRSNFYNFYITSYIGKLAYNWSL